jgi:arsenate reductase
MAEGFARRLAPESVQVYSAGTEPKEIHTLAIKVMREIGVDISNQRSKGVEQVPTEKIDLVVTLCSEAQESCPTLSKKTEYLHWPLSDPALVTGDDAQVLKVFRNVRDEIRMRVADLFSHT